MVDYVILNGNGSVIGNQENIKSCSECYFFVNLALHNPICVIKSLDLINCNPNEEIDKGCPLQPGYKLEL